MNCSLQRAKKAPAISSLCTRAATALLAALILLVPGCTKSREHRIVVGSKNFTEQLVLGELIAQQLEAKTGLEVERRFYLAGTYICHQAILAGRIDVYPEYTGTALTAVLKQPPKGTKEEVYNEIKSEYAKRFNLAIGQTLGFSDTFAMQIRGEDAHKLNIKTISDAVKHAPLWHAGFRSEEASCRERV